MLLYSLFRMVMGLALFLIGWSKRKDDGVHTGTPKSLAYPVMIAGFGLMAFGLHDMLEG